MRRSSNAPGARGGAWLVVATAFVTLVLRLPWLTQSLWFDEVFRTFVFLRGEAARELLLHDVHNPLYNAFMYVWIRAFGDGEVSIRVPSLVAAYVTAGVVWWWGDRRLGNGVGAIAAVFLMLSPVWGWFACEAKNNAVLLMIATGAVVALCEAAWERRARWVVGAAVMTTLAVWADFTALVVIGPALCVLLWRGVRPESVGGAMVDGGVWRRCASVLVAVGIACVLALPLVVFKARSLDAMLRGHVLFFHPWEAARLLMVWFPTGDALLPWWRERWWWSALALAPVTVVMGWCGVRALLRVRGFGAVVIACIVGPLLIMWAGSELGALRDPKVYMYQARNVLCVMPFMALASAAGVMGLRGARAKSVVGGAGAAVMLVASVLAVTVWRGEKILDFHPKGNWRGAAAWVRERGGEEPVLVSLSALMPMRYYMPRATLREERMEDVLAAEGFGDTERGGRGAFIIIHERWVGESAPEQLREIHAKLRVVEEVELEGLWVVRVAE